MIWSRRSKPARMISSASNPDRDVLLRADRRTSRFRCSCSVRRVIPIAGNTAMACALDPRPSRYGWDCNPLCLCRRFDESHDDTTRGTKSDRSAPAYPLDPYLESSAIRGRKRARPTSRQNQWSPGAISHRRNARREDNDASPSSNPSCGGNGRGIDKELATAASLKRWPKQCAPGTSPSTLLEVNSIS